MSSGWRSSQASTAKAFITETHDDCVETRLRSCFKGRWHTCAGRASLAPRTVETRAQGRPMVQRRGSNNRVAKMVRSCPGQMDSIPQTLLSRARHQARGLAADSGGGPPRPRHSRVQFARRRTQQRGCIATIPTTNDTTAAEARWRPPRTRPQISTYSCTVRPKATPGRPQGRRWPERRAGR